MVLKELFDIPKTASSDTIELYHVGNDIQFMKSFLQEGAKAIGRGVGGQKDGLYLWTRRAKAEDHILFKDTLGFYYGSSITMREESDFSPEGGIMIGVRILKKDMTYPTWQIDYEFNSKYLMEIFDKYADKIEKLKNFPFKEFDTEYVCTKIQKSKIVSHGFAYQKNNAGMTNFNLKDMGPKTTGIVQAICDKMCAENPEFLLDYNQALSKTIQDVQGQAVKYTGHKPLIPSYVSLILGNQAGCFHEDVLYTDQKPAQKQVCPFVAVKLKKAKSR